MRTTPVEHEDRSGSSSGGSPVETATPRSALKRTNIGSYRLSVWSIRIGILVGVFGLWELAAARQWVDVFFSGQPTAIWSLAIEQVTEGRLLEHTWTTASEALIGFTAGVAAGTAAGLSLWFSRRLADAISPLVVIFNATPKIALAPLLLVWVGIGYWMKVSLSFLIVLIVAWIVAYDGSRNVDRDLVNLFRSLGASRLQIFRKVVVPFTLPWVISALKLCIGFALTGAVVGEFVAANRGLGFLILYASGSYSMNLVWVALFTLMAVSTVLFVLIGKLEAYLLRHQERASPTV